MAKSLRCVEDVADNFIDERFDSMVGVMQGMQKTALKLTELVLNHCKIEDLNEEKVFEIFSNAVFVAGEAFENQTS